MAKPGVTATIDRGRTAATRYQRQDGCAQYTASALTWRVHPQIHKVYLCLSESS